jgi:hypothetical protein
MTEDHLIRSFLGVCGGPFRGRRTNLLLRQGRPCLVKLRSEYGDLLLGAGYPRFVAVELSLLLNDIGSRLLGALDRAVAGMRQIGVALEILLRIDERGLVGRDDLPRLLDPRGSAARFAVAGVDDLESGGAGWLSVWNARREG